MILLMFLATFVFFIEYNTLTCVCIRPFSVTTQCVVADIPKITSKNMRNIRYERNFAIVSGFLIQQFNF